MQVMGQNPLFFVQERVLQIWTQSCTSLTSVKLPTENSTLEQLLG